MFPPENVKVTEKRDVPLNSEPRECAEVLVEFLSKTNGGIRRGFWCTKRVSMLDGEIKGCCSDFSYGSHSWNSISAVIISEKIKVQGILLN